MPLYYYFFIAIFGLVVGSFINVVVLRLNTGKSIVMGRSMCFACRATLSWQELLPVISFVIQGGKCKHCGSRISWQYPIVEAITSAVFVWMSVEYGISYPLVWYAIIFSILIAIAVYDTRHKIIPDVLVYLFVLLSLISLFFNYGANIKNISLSLDTLAGPIFFSFFAILWLVSMGKWMGFGDAKLSLGIGFLLGWGQGLAAEAIGFWLGAIVGILMLFIQRRYLTIKHEIPLAPFLVIGTFLAFIFKLNILDWIY